MNDKKKVEHFLFKLSGLLNFVGGNFDVESLEKASFAEIAEACFLNGIEIEVSLNSDKKARIGG